MLRLNVKDRLCLLQIWPGLNLELKAISFAAGIAAARLGNADFPPCLAWVLVLLSLMLVFRLVKGFLPGTGRQPECFLTLAFLFFWFLGGFLRQGAVSWPAPAAEELAAGTRVSGYGFIEEMVIQEAGDYAGPRLRLVLSLDRRQEKNSRTYADMGIAGAGPAKQKEGAAAWSRQRRFLLRVSLPSGCDPSEYCKDKGLQAGSRLSFAAEIQELRGPRNPGEYDQIKGLASQGIYCQGKAGSVDVRLIRQAPLWRRLIAGARAGILAKIEKEIPGGEGAVTAACLLGETAGMTEEDLRAYRKAGIAHLFAVSGTHGGIILALSRLTLSGRKSRAGRRQGPALLFPLGMLFVYLALTGFPLSMQRTFLMALAAQAAGAMGRKKDQGSVLAGAALLLLLKRPQYLLNCGFQLSFGVTWGIVRLSPWLEKKLPAGPAAALSAQLAAMPIQAYWFYQIQPFGFFINLFAVALMPALLVLSLAAVLVGIPLPGPGSLLWQAAGFTALVMDGAAKGWSRLPFSSLTIAGQAWPFYFLWGIGVWLLPEIKSLELALDRRLEAGWRKKELEPSWQAWRSFYRQKKQAAAAGRPDGRLFSPAPGAGFSRRLFQRLWRRRRAAAAVFLAASLAAKALLPGPLTLCFLDVGQGDGCFLRTPKGSAWLIDAGSGNIPSLAEYRLLPFLQSQGVDSLDYVLISHPDGDHISGVAELLPLLPVKCLFLSPAAYAEEAGRNLAEKAAAFGTKIFLLNQGDRIRQGGVELICLNPPEGHYTGDSNADSLVVRLNYRKFSALFTGDIPQEVEYSLLAGGIGEPVTLLKVAHHGSGSSSSADFLNGLAPELAVISCAENNLYGHPHPRVLEDLRKAGVKIYQTRSGGAITLTTRGKRLKIKSFISAFDSF